MIGAPEHSLRGVYILAMATIFLTMVVMSYLAIDLLFPRSIVTVNVVPIPVEAKTIRAGDALVLRFDYCKTQDRHALSGLTMQQADDPSLIITFPVVVTSLQTGCHVVRLAFQIPDWIPAGNYRAFVTREYRPSVLREVQAQVETERFQVVH